VGRSQTHFTTYSLTLHAPASNNIEQTRRRWIPFFPNIECSVFTEIPVFSASARACPLCSLHLPQDMQKMPHTVNAERRDRLKAKREEDASQELRISLIDRAGIME
jgi:hypothetical protein